MMKEMAYDLRCGEGLNFEKGWHISLQPFVRKRKPANYYDQTRRELGYVTLSIQFESESEESLPSYSSDSSDWESYIRVGADFKNLFANITSISRWIKMKILSHSIPIHRLNNLICSGRNISNNDSTKDKVIQVDVSDQTHPKLISISVSLSPTER